MVHQESLVSKRSRHEVRPFYKRPGLMIPLILIDLTIIVLVVLWALGEYRIRALSGRLALTGDLSGSVQTLPAGSFAVTLDGPNAQLSVTRGGKTLWQTLPGRAFFIAARGEAAVEESRGSFFIRDTLGTTCTRQSIGTFRAQGGGEVAIEGQLTCSGGSTRGYTLGYSVLFRPVEDNQLAFQVALADPGLDDPARLNRVYLTYASDSAEHFFGFGEQFSNFDHKGQRVPIWVSEQGIGRGAQPITTLVNLAAKAGGNAYTTYAAVPFYLTSRMNALFLENAGYTVFDLRQDDRVQVSSFDVQFRGRILYGETPADLIGEYTRWAGRMRPLPDWILDGAVVGMQGGTEKVRQVYDQLKQRGAPVSAFWLQDWVGQRTTSFGKQLWWNWELDTERYPEWPALMQTLAADDVRVMLYASPFLADVAALKPNLRRNLFEEARNAGYLVRHEDGSPYLILNTDFSAGLLDLTNPAAVQWYQGVLQTELVDIGASGWMADFGEALPYDGVLSNGMRGAEYHNRYPQEWARLNRQFVDSLPNGGDMVFFTRAAFAQSPAFTTLMWEGDQLVTWDEHDGIKSAVTGLLSGGVSGFSLNHSDIGGYTGINNPLAKTTRGKELLLRWMELSALTAVYRTHEGNLPDLNAQFYSDAESLDHFTRMAKLYTAWGAERKRLVAEAAETGLPVARPLFLHYPADPVTYRLSYQEYLLGPDLLVAPVLDPAADSVRAYLPAGDWVHAWTGTAYHTEGEWVTVSAPLGQPGLFYRKGSQAGAELVAGLKAAGLGK